MRGFEPPHLRRYHPLKMACLPIPPPRRPHAILYHTPAPLSHPRPSLRHSRAPPPSFPCTPFVILAPLFRHSGESQNQGLRWIPALPSESSTCAGMTEGGYPPRASGYQSLPGNYYYQQSLTYSPDYWRADAGSAGGFQ